jgi:hypothetical protein
MRYSWHPARLEKLKNACKILVENPVREQFREIYVDERTVLK